jgi:NhaA family Na+:H+ antiporter
MPVFAFSNAGITLEGVTLQDVLTPITMGIFLGLLLGKFLGVVGISWIFLKLKWATLPEDMTFKNLYGAGFLAGIGFTMSLFITNLAFSSPQLILQAKIGTLAASLLAGLIGFLLLKKTLPQTGQTP